MDGAFGLYQTAANVFAVSWNTSWIGISGISVIVRNAIMYFCISEQFFWCRCYRRSMLGISGVAANVFWRSDGSDRRCHADFFDYDIGSK